MKILFEWPRQSHYDPEQFAGGTEKWASYNFNLLREKYDVTLLVPDGKEYDFPYISTGVNPLRYGVDRSVFNYRTFWNTIAEVSDQFDYIVIVSLFQSAHFRRHTKTSEFAHKIIFVQHYYERVQADFSSYDGWINHLHVIKHGGKILSPNKWVTETSNTNWLSRYEEDYVIKRCKFDPKESREVFDKSSYGVFNGHFDIIHHLHDAAPIVSQCDYMKIVWIGRANNDKGFSKALKTLSILEEQGYEIHLFLRNDNHNKEDWIELTDYTDNGAMFNVWLNLDHSEIMKQISDANILLWTTTKETVGLVGYEAACHGLKVVYNLDQPECYLGDWGFRHNARSAKQLAQFVNEVTFAEHDREGQAKYFREKYTRENDLAQWNEVLVPRTK